MNTIAHYSLVDFENVGLPGLCGLNMLGDDSEIRFFLSNTAHAATEDVYHDILNSRAQVATTFCSETHKNAVDFQLTAYFGLILEREGTARINIVSNVILEFCHIRQPLLVRSICMEIPIQVVPGDVCRIITAPGAALRLPLDRGLNTLFPTDP